MPETPTLLRIGVTVEGESDQRFFAALLPRLVRDVAAEVSVVTIALGMQDPASLADTVCRVFTDRAIDIVCVHRDADSANAAPQRRQFAEAACGSMAERCKLPAIRCVPLIPFREMETWALADPAALADLFRCALPREFVARLRQPEALTDPKRTLRELAAAIQRRPRPIPFDRLGSTITLDALDRLESYRAFRDRFQNAYLDVVTTALRELAKP